MSRNLLVFSSLFFLISCASLSRSSVINHNQKDEVISIVSVEIIYDGEPEPSSGGIGGFCRLLFHDHYEVNLLKFRHEKNSAFYVIKSEPGKMLVDSLVCKHPAIPLIPSKNRKIDLTHFAFWAAPGYVNYLGHIVINYKPSEFNFLDLFGLGGLKADGEGKFDVRIEDRVDDAVNFLSKNYPELKNISLTKSFIEDISSLKPNTKPEAYSPTKNSAPPPKVSEPISTTTNSPESSNPYYTPQQNSPAVTYFNPYENQEKAGEKVEQK